MVEAQATKDREVFCRPPCVIQAVPSTPHRLGDREAVHIIHAQPSVQFLFF
jgi:hypothetical protein